MSKSLQYKHLRLDSMSLNRVLSARIFIIAVGAIIFGMIGYETYHHSHALTPTAQIEAENGTLATNAAVVADSTTSNNKGVQFNAPVTGGAQVCPAYPAFPDANCTGVPTGVTLTTYTGPTTITTAGTIIDSKNITSPLTISANNVTIKNSRITATPPDNKGVVTITGGYTGTLIQDCEINGLGNGTNGHGILGRATIYRCDISNVENGLVPDNNTLAEDNYIHNLGGAQSVSGGVPHYDGVQMDGGESNVTLRHNTINNNYTQTSAVMMDNYFGALSNIIVTNNFLSGGGITLYHVGNFTSSTMTGTQVTGNYFGTTDWLNAEICVFDVSVWSGNINASTGATVPKPAVTTAANCK